MTSVPLTSAEDSSRAQSKLSAETRAIRMLHAGDDPKLVAQTTGLSLDDVRRIQRDTPGLVRPSAPRPVATPPEPAIGCDHLLELPIRQLLTHPANVRTDLGDAQQLDELAQSIRQHGILQPLRVMRLDREYVVLAGHRRLAAAQRAGLHAVPVTIGQPLDTDQAIEAMLVENLQRTDLHPLDEAAAYARLIRAGRTQTDIARSIGKDPGHVSTRLALNNLTDAEKDALRNKEISVQDGYLAGRDRSAGRRAHDTKRPKPKVVPHFTKAHPLAGAADALCTHDTLLKLGPACGPCWEYAIRTDEQRLNRGGDTA